METWVESFLVLLVSRLNSIMFLASMKLWSCVYSILPPYGTFPKSELLETITRRGTLGNIVMDLLPMIFYLTLNLVVFLLSFMWHLAGV